MQTDRMNLSKQQLETFIKSLSRALIQPDIGRLDRMANSYLRKELICDDDAKYLFSILRSFRPQDSKYDIAALEESINLSRDRHKPRISLWRLSNYFKKNR